MCDVREKCLARSNPGRLFERTRRRRLATELDSHPEHHEKRDEKKFRNKMKKPETPSSLFRILARLYTKIFFHPLSMFVDQEQRKSSLVEETTEKTSLAGL
jgi:hypothetical protein